MYGKSWSAGIEYNGFKCTVELTLTVLFSENCVIISVTNEWRNISPLALTAIMEVLIYLTILHIKGQGYSGKYSKGKYKTTLLFL